MGVVENVLAYTDRQVGKKYSQSKRYQDGYFDCSSLVYRAFESTGVKLVHKDTGGRVDVSYREVYAKGFSLVYPDSYDGIGKGYAPKGITNQYQPGDVVFCSPGRTKKISHVMIVNQHGGVTHAANESVGVVKNGLSTHADTVLAVIRYGNGRAIGGQGGTAGQTQKQEITQVKVVYSTGGKPEPKREALLTAPPVTEKPYQLLIQHEGEIQIPVVQEGVSLQRERRGAPSQLTFSVLKSDGLNFQEGDPVSFKVKGEGAFYGYVFKKSRNNDGLIKVTAYDQIRYLKYHDTFQHDSITASQLLQRIAGDYNLKAGSIADTGYSLAPAIIDDKALLDVLEDALMMTLVMTGEMLVLYDDFGKLTLKNNGDMALDILINNQVAEDFDYTSSIDSNTYNKIKLAYDNGETGVKEVYEEQDGASVGQWGILQKVVKADSVIGIQEKLKSYLKLYNRKTRNLSIKNVMGDIRVRGGSKVYIQLDLGDIIAGHQMTVESVKHSFGENAHFMDLTLKGWDFV